MPFYACTDPFEVAVVCSMTIDELLGELGLSRVDWIKIDVEGAETMVLRGGRRLLEGSKNLKLIIENSTGAAARYLRDFGLKHDIWAKSYFAEKTKT
jgi:hypothetical protein